MKRPLPNLKEALGVLSRHQVEFIVVGGVAAVVAGAPISTFDLDIVQARTPDNIDRLLAALTELDAIYRDFSGRVIRPDRDTLLGPGHHLLRTRYGPLDVLGAVADAAGYDELLPDTVEHVVGEYRIRVIGLARLIRLKEAVGRDKDRAVLPILRRTLDESTK